MLTGLAAQVQRMKAQSAATRTMDPFKAGVELGEGLAALPPEAVLLFTSIQYSDTADILEGLREVLGKDTLILGATGDGVMERQTCSNMGAVALGLNGEGNVRWALGQAGGAEKNPRRALRSCVKSLHDQLAPEEPALYLLLSDFHADGDILEQTLQDVVTAPVVGGLAGDDYTIERSRVYANGRVREDAMVMLALVGNIRYTIRMARAMKPIGKPGVVTGTSKNRVTRIDHISARAFLERETGKPLMRIDRGQMVFRLERLRDHGQSALRSMAADGDAPDDSVRIYGTIRKGEVVQLCHATPRHITESAEETASAGRIKDVAAGLMISCAGRKQIMGNDPGCEFKILRKPWGARVPACGFASYGEFSPIAKGRSYTPTLFHNMTTVLLTLWK